MSYYYTVVNYFYNFVENATVNFIMYDVVFQLFVDFLDGKYIFKTYQPYGNSATL